MGIHLFRSIPRSRFPVTNPANFLEARFLDNFWIADKLFRIAASAELLRRIIIARTHGTHLWHESRPLQDHRASGSGWHGRGVSCTRLAVGPRSRYQGLAQLLFPRP